MTGQLPPDLKTLIANEFECQETLSKFYKRSESPMVREVSWEITHGNNYEPSEVHEFELWQQFEAYNR